MTTKRDIHQTLTCSTADGHGGAHLSQELGAGLQGAQGGSHAPRDPDHSQSVPQAGGFLVGEARQGTDAAQTRTQVHHLERERLKRKRREGAVCSEGPGQHLGKH